MNFVKYSFLQKKIIISILIFAAVFLVLVCPFAQWGVFPDDYGNLFESQITSLKDLFTLSYAKDFNLFYVSSNYVALKQSFFNVYYRPLLRLFWSIEYYFFGVHLYPYFVVWMFLHALSAVAFFYIVCSFFESLLIASWAALYFSFHICLGSWVGPMSISCSPLCLLLLQLSLICFFLFLKKKSYTWLFLSLFAYGSVLFTYENLIVFVLFISSLFLIRSFLQKHYPYFPSDPYKYLSYISGFWLVTIMFLVIRLFYFPLGALKGSLLTKNVIIVKHFYMIATTYIAHFTNISFIPSEYHRLKIALFLACASAFWWAWNKSIYKMVPLFFLFHTVLFMWPSMRFYDIRYMYFSLTIFIFLVLILVYPYLKKNSVGYVMSIIGWGVIGLNLFLMLSQLALRERTSHTDEMAFRELVMNRRIYGRPLCFIGAPLRFISSTAQAIWLYGVNRSLPIYYDPDLFVFPAKQSEIIFIPIKKGYRAYFPQRDNGFCSLCEGSFWGGGSHKMGTLIKNSIDGNYDVSYIFDDIYLRQNPLFIGWNFKTSRFFILPPPLE